jgi:hypothetical protein
LFRLPLDQDRHDLGPVQSLKDENRRSDPPISQLYVLDAEHGSDWGAGDEVVDDASLVPVDEQVPNVVPLDDREQSPERADECLSAADSVVAKREFRVWFEKRGQTLESPFADGLDVRSNENAGIARHVSLLRAKFGALEIIKLTL